MSKAAAGIRVSAAAAGSGVIGRRLDLQCLWMALAVIVGERECVKGACSVFRRERDREVDGCIMEE